MEILMNELIKCYKAFNEIGKDELIDRKAFLDFIEESIGVVIIVLFIHVFISILITIITGIVSKKR